MTTYTGRQAVTLVRRSPGPPDAYGVYARVETRETVTGCSVQPLGSDEQLSDADRVTTRVKLFAPAGTVLTATDAVETGGVVYEVDGDPEFWTDHRGTPHHVECLLRRATG